MVSYLLFGLTYSKLSAAQHATEKDSGGKPFEITYRVTDFWRKRNGQWKLIDSHLSFPVDMKTGKADLAAKM